ncbi:MAG: GNAT family N-acetyltransferase [Spirochaetaceae bacterium]|nr:MAG: GNAT family N-acetyltransferase [Spirochaetaceae bacterium]
MEIIPATPAHLESIIEIWKDFMDYHALIDPFFTRSENGHESFRRYVTGEIPKDDSFLFVCIDNGLCIGYILGNKSTYPPVFKKSHYCQISDIAVLPKYRRKGIGEKFLACVKVWAKERELDRIELRVVASNQLAYSFYRKHGFKDYLHNLFLEI